MRRIEEDGEKGRKELVNFSASEIGFLEAGEICSDPQWCSYLQETVYMSVCVSMYVSCRSTGEHS